MIKIGRNSYQVIEHVLLESVVRELAVRPKKPLRAIAQEYAVNPEKLYRLLSEAGWSVQEARKEGNYAEA